MSTPDDRTIKSFQRLIAPSADATDDDDVSPSDERDPAPSRHQELLRRARDVLREHGEPMPAGALAQRVFGTGEGVAGGAWVALLNQLLRASSAFA